MSKKVEKKVEKSIDILSNIDLDKLVAFEQALLAGIAAGIINLSMVDNVINQAGFKVDQVDHEACKPVSLQEQASAMLSQFVDLAKVQGQDKTKDLLGAFEAYQKHCFAADTNNGTSLSTHFIYNQIKQGKTIYNHEVIAYVQKYLSTYTSHGHINTCKRLLKKHGFKLNIFKGGFSVLN